MIFARRCCTTLQVLRWRPALLALCRQPPAAATTQADPPGPHTVTPQEALVMTTPAGAPPLQLGDAQRALRLAMAIPHSRRFSWRRPAQCTPQKWHVWPIRPLASDPPAGHGTEMEVSKAVEAYHKVVNKSYYETSWIQRSLRLSAPRLRKMFVGDRNEAFQTLARESRSVPEGMMWEHMRKMQVPTRRLAGGVRPLPRMFNPATGRMVQTTEERAQVLAADWSKTEVATPIDPVELCQKALDRQRLRVGRMAPPAPEDLLTLDMLEHAVRRTKTGKAAGHDGIPAEVYKVDPARMAMVLLPLALKQSGLLCEPVQFKGGEAKELWKKKGSTAASASYRSILLAETLGKIVRSALRPQLVEVAMEAFSPTQCGGMPGRSTEYPAHMARLFTVSGHS